MRWREFGYNTTPHLELCAETLHWETFHPKLHCRFNSYSMPSDRTTCRPKSWVYGSGGKGPTEGFYELAWRAEEPRSINKGDRLSDDTTCSIGMEAAVMARVTGVLVEITVSLKASPSVPPLGLMAF